jgi:hypothetical protein
MAKLDIGVGEEFPLEEKGRDEDCRHAHHGHWHHHHDHHGRGHHDHHHGSWHDYFRQRFSRRRDKSGSGKQDKE